MSTRATIHFMSKGQTKAIIYRHNDGYPDGLGKDINTFLNEVSKLKDTRFNDPSYLAAKWVVWDSKHYSSVIWDSKHYSKDPLDFLSVGVVLYDPPDIEYCYGIHCDSLTRPKVEVFTFE